MKTRNMTTSFTARSLTVASLLTAGLMAGASAQTPATAPSAASTPRVSTAVKTPKLTIRQIYDQLDAAGYRDLREIEWSDGRYEVKGRNARGDRVKLDVDGTTGAILRERSKN